MRRVYRKRKPKDGLLKILFGILFAIIAFIIIGINKNIITGLTFILSGSIALSLIISGLVIFIRGVRGKIPGEYTPKIGPYCHNVQENKDLESPGYLGTCKRCEASIKSDD